MSFCEFVTLLTTSDLSPKTSWKTRCTQLVFWPFGIGEEYVPSSVCPVTRGQREVCPGRTAIHATPALLCLLFALLIQIGTNFANDLIMTF